MSTTLQPYGTLTGLEHERDQLVARLLTVMNETDPHTVEGFAFQSTEDAESARTQVVDMVLERIREVNHSICGLIYPHHLVPAARITARVMQSLGSHAPHRARREGRGR